MSRNRSKMTSWMQACVGLLALQLVLLVSTERPARAYVDPGSGALVWQGLLAAVVGSLFYLRRIIGWLKTRFLNGKSD